MDRRKISDRNREILSFLKTANSAGRRFPKPDELPLIAREGLKGRKSGALKKRVSSRISGDRFLATISIVGTIPAGVGESSEPAELGSIPVDLEALNIKSSACTFALKVRGNSMTGAHIADGDLVIVEAREPKVGDIVAALIDGETTLKRFVTENGRLFLRAENPEFPDLVPLQDLVIQGVVRAVVRVCHSRGGK